MPRGDVYLPSACSRQRGGAPLADRDLDRLASAPGHRADDVRLKGIDFSNVPPDTCDFARCVFVDVDFQTRRCKRCFFDFCLFERCTFDGCERAPFGGRGSKLMRCSFKDSLLIHTNFMGIDARECDFSSSDLYYSNFSSSHLVEVQFVDCNLKNADFRFTDRKNVSFKYSNMRRRVYS